MSLETLIAAEERIKGAFCDEAVAFKEIAETGLYKFSGHKNFDDYCDKRAGCGARHGWRMVNAGSVVQTLLAAPIGKLWLPSNERQAREFAKLPEGQDIEHAAQLVYDRASKKNGKVVITAESIRETFIHDKIIRPRKKWSETEKQAQLDRSIRRAFINLWQAFADLGIDPKEAVSRFDDYVFGDGYDEALVYMMRLEELRNG